MGNITIKKVFTWFNVYIDKTMILKNLSQNDIDDIIKTLKETNTKYNYVVCEC